MSITGITEFKFHASKYLSLSTHSSICLQYINIFDKLDITIAQTLVEYSNVTVMLFTTVGYTTVCMNYI